MTTAAESFLRKQVPRASMKGPGWDLMLGVIGTSEQANWDLAAAAENQLFESTASGRYLERLAARSGIRKPAGVGMQDEDFRQLLVVVNAAQVTPESFLGVLEVFYGLDATHASVTSAAAGPYSIPDGATLGFTFNGKTSVTAVFRNADFANSNAALPIEVAAVLNRCFRQNGVSALALSANDPQTNLARVVVYSGTPGLSGSVQVTGGLAQAVFQFPSLLPVTLSPALGWTVSRNGSRTRFSTPHASWGDTVRAGDYVLINDLAFNGANTGSFSIVAASSKVLTHQSWFEVENPAGIAQGPLLLNQTSGIQFYRPRRSTLYDQPRAAFIRQARPNIVDVSVPATASVVKREPGTAAYLVGNQPISISSATLDTARSTLTVSTSTAHGLSVGSQVFVDGLAFPAGANSPGGAINGMFGVASVLSGTMFTVKPADGSSVTGSVVNLLVADAAITAFAAPVHARPNPIIYDPASGLAVTDSFSTMSAQVEGGHSAAVLTVADATQFPDAPGHLVVGLGYDYQAGPIPYLGRASNTQLLLDPSFVFPQTVPAGARVNWLTSPEPLTPRDPADDGAFYLTGSAAGRVAASALLAKLAASGITLRTSVVYPGDRGLANEGAPVKGAARLSDVVSVFAGDDVDAELEAARASDAI